MKSVMKIPMILLLGLTLQVVAVSTGSFHLRRDDPSKKDKVPTVVKVENKIREHAKKNKGRLMDMIEKFRAEICYKMHDEFGIKFETFKACHKFMEKTCNPGKDMEMDGDAGEVSSGEGYCKQYFPEAEEKAEKAVKKEEEEEEKAAAAEPPPSAGPSGPASAPAPQPVPPGLAAPAPAPQKAAAAPAGAAGASPAPAPGPMGAPGPAPGPVPGPFIPGVTGGKPWGKIAKDEAYYYKKGGKDAGRLHMSEKLGVPAQGYWGKLVEHEDGETSTDDWGKEFGPPSGHDNIKVICMKKPDSKWCRQRGLGPHKASAMMAGHGHILAGVLAVLGAAAF